MAWLLITGDDRSERAIALGERSLRIGRSADCDIILADAGKSVSRVHAELRCEQGRYVIVDLESQNGTWVNGERVQRAEVPVDGEVRIGTFRLRRQQGDLPGTTTATLQTGESAAEAGWPDPVVRRTADARPGSSSGPTSQPARSSMTRSGVAIVFGVAVIGAVAWRFLGGSTGVPSTSPAPRIAPASIASPAVAPPALPSPPAVSPAPPDPPAAKPPRAAAGVAAPARQPAGGSASTRRPLSTQPPVPRKLGESVEAWRNRIAALEARYEYSRAALVRGDFGSAASGFEAILRSEPGFGDAPDLLVQARAGLRAAATSLVSAGDRLEAAGDWVGAQQQYARARELDPDTPGIDEAEGRVREQLRTAGHEALNRGLEQERLGHPLEALQEFTKALQWLPADDSGTPVARAHAERLRLLKKE